MADKKDKCAHPACVCRAADDSKYCSALCEGAAEHPDIVCNCGHAGCTASAATTMGSRAMGRTFE